MSDIENCEYDREYTLTVNAFTLTGWTFDGWNTAANGSGTSYGNGATVSNLTPNNGETVTLYARWTANTYYVVFDGNGNTEGSTDEQLVTYDVATQLTANGFTKTGYTFVGWKASQEGGYYGAAADSCTTSVTEASVIEDGAFIKNLSSVNNAEVIFTAQWQANDYDITFNIQHPGSGTVALTIDSAEVTVDADGSYTLTNGVTYDGAVNVTAIATNTTGWVFQGFYTEASGGTQLWTKDGNNTTGNTYINADGEWIYDGNVTVYAQWASGSYTITLNGVNRTGTSTVNYTYNPTVVQSVEIDYGEAAGWVFNGWTINLNSSGVSSYVDDFDDKLLIIPAGAYGNMELTANWIGGGYTIYIDENGGNSVSDLSYNTSVEVQTVTLNIPTYTGHSLTGWIITTQSSSGESSVSGNTLTIPALDYGDITVQAQWQEDSYTIRYVTNGGNEVTPVEVVATYNSDSTAQSAIFTKTGYTQSGWNTANDGSGTQVDLGATISAATINAWYGEVGKDGIKILYATWEANFYIVTFAFKTGESYSSANLGTVAYDGGVTDVDATTEFAVRYDDDKLYVKVAGDYKAVSYITTANHVGYKNPVATTTVGGTTYTMAEQDLAQLGGALDGTYTETTTAAFTITMNPIEYTIVFNAGAGVGSMDSMAATYNAPLQLNANAFTKVGYHFVGWSCSTTGGYFGSTNACETRIVNGEQLIGDQNYVKNLTSSDAADVILTAIFEANTYNISAQDSTRAITSGDYADLTVNGVVVTSANGFTFNSANAAITEASATTASTVTITNSNTAYYSLYAVLFIYNTTSYELVEIAEAQRPEESTTVTVPAFDAAHRANIQVVVLCTINTITASLTGSITNKNGDDITFFGGVGTYEVVSSGYETEWAIHNNDTDKPDYNGPAMASASVTVRMGETIDLTVTALATGYYVYSLTGSTDEDKDEKSATYATIEESTAVEVVFYQVMLTVILVDNDSKVESKPKDYAYGETQIDLSTSYFSSIICDTVEDSYARKLAGVADGVINDWVTRSLVEADGNIIWGDITHRSPQYTVADVYSAHGFTAADGDVSITLTATYYYRVEVQVTYEVERTVLAIDMDSAATQILATETVEINEFYQGETFTTPTSAEIAENATYSSNTASNGIVVTAATASTVVEIATTADYTNGENTTLTFAPTFSDKTLTQLIELGENYSARVQISVPVSYGEQSYMMVITNSIYALDTPYNTSAEYKTVYDSLGVNATHVMINDNNITVADAAAIISEHFITYWDEVTVYVETFYYFYTLDTVTVGETEITVAETGFTAGDRLGKGVLINNVVAVEATVADNWGTIKYEELKGSGVIGGYEQTISADPTQAFNLNVLPDDVNDKKYFGLVWYAINSCDAVVYIYVDAANYVPGTSTSKMSYTAFDGLYWYMRDTGNGDWTSDADAGIITLYGKWEAASVWVEYGETAETAVGKAFGKLGDDPATELNNAITYAKDGAYAYVSLELMNKQGEARTLTMNGVTIASGKQWTIATTSLDTFDKVTKAYVMSENVVNNTIAAVADDTSTTALFEINGTLTVMSVDICTNGNTGKVFDVENNSELSVGGVTVRSAADGSINHSGIVIWQAGGSVNVDGLVIIGITAVSYNGESLNEEYVIAIYGGSGTYRNVVLHNCNVDSEDGTLIGMEPTVSTSEVAFENLEITYGETDPNVPEVPDFWNFTYELTEDGKGIYFGEYPQSLAAPGVIFSSVPDVNGYYLGSDGERYAKYTIDWSDLVEAGVDSMFTEAGFDMNKTNNGTYLIDGETYYFKVEKLLWQIVSVDANNVATIVCTSIISQQTYQSYYAEQSENYWITDIVGNILDGVYANNYKYSMLRSFLINDFYNKAFNPLQKLLIKQISVNNGAATTGDASNPYACETTNDKVWALSVEEVETLGAAGTLSITDLLRATTDYAKATGSATYTTEFCALHAFTPHVILTQFFGETGVAENATYESVTANQKELLDIFYSSGGWSLRSPSAGGSHLNAIVVCGGIFSDNVYSPMNGVVPALKIQLTDSDVGGGWLDLR